MSTRVLVVGAGFVGLYAALRLERTLPGAEIVVVNPENFMQYQPFLPEAAAGLIEPRHLVVPLRQVLRRSSLIAGEVERIDHPSRTAVVRNDAGETSEVGYDHVVVAAGSRSRVLPVPGLAEHGVGFKTVAEAIHLRNAVLSRLELAAQSRDPLRRRAALTFVFVGGGYAGVEALAELEDMARDALRYYPSIDRAEMRWVLVDAAARIVPEIGPRLGIYVLEQLSKRGIEVLLSTRLQSATAGRIVLSNGFAFDADTLVWTAGVKPTPLAARSKLPVDDAGRVLADAYLRVRDTPHAWAAGDGAAVPDLRTGGLCPPTAQHALRQARRLADNLTADLTGGRLRAFRHSNLGHLASLGRHKGVARPLGIPLRGFPAWWLHRTYHLSQMPTFNRKVRIAMDWTVGLLFPRDLVQLGSLQRPKDPFERAYDE